MDADEGTPRIFVSCAETDLTFARWLAESLSALGHHLWLPGASAPSAVQPFDRIQQALEESEVMLLVITPAALKSRLVSSEWMYFLGDSQKVLIPVLLEPPVSPDRINFMLAAAEHADFSRGDHDAALGALHQRLLEAYASLRAKQKPWAEPVLASYRTPAPRLPSGGSEPQSAGLAAVHMGLPLEQFGACLRQASLIIRVMNTWTGVFVDYAKWLVEAVRRGTQVQILLLQPSSAIARQRSLDVYLSAGHAAPNDDEVPHNIRTSIRQIASLYPEAQAGPGKLELRLYNRLPSFSVHQCDNTAFVGFFPHATRTTTFPMLEVELPSTFGRLIEEEFRQVWESSTLVDLRRQFAPETEAANQALAEPLSARELEILELISAGLSNREIADRLVVTVATIKKHINSLYAKLDVSTRTRALLRAQELGLASPAAQFH